MNDMDKTIPPQRHIDPVGDDVTMPGKRDRKPDGRFSPGDLILGRYKVLSELGQGGMGVVYKCFDETAGIEVALKALPPELSHNTLEMEDIKENFQLVAKLVHQNIAISKNLEKDNSNGNYYLIMECCNGEDLRRWIRRKRNENSLTLETVLPVVKQVADALDYAHKQKIIHRDIKPGNIMIDPAGDVKVLDFGLAAQIHTSMTRVSMAYHGTSGTGPYMAPEQWKGRTQGAAADQYALAVMTYEMLAGHLPFESQDPAVLREAVLHETAEQIPDLYKTAQNALIKAMSKDPSERFAGCAEFIAALSGKKIASNGKSNAKWIGLISGAVLLVLILAGSGIYLHQQKTAKENAKAQRLAALKQQEKADQEKRIAKEKALKKAEEERIAKEKALKKAEEERIAKEKALKKAEEERIAKEKADQEKQIAKEKALKKAKEERIAKENDEKQRQAVLKQPTPKREENFSVRQGSNEEQSLTQAEILKQAELRYDIKAYSEALGFYNKLTGELPLENLMHKGECFEKIKSYEQAILCYRQAERRGFNDSDCRLGILSEKRGEWKDAVASYSELIERKNYHAAYRLALIYLNGKGGFVESPKGYELLKLAADSGYVQAQYILGCSYAKFRGTDKFTIIKYDLDKAQQYLQKAKINGHKEAENRLKFLGGN